METVWFWKGPQLTESWAKTAAFPSETYPKPSTITDDLFPVSEVSIYETDIDQNGHLVILLTGEQFAPCPDLWFVLEQTNHPTDMYCLHGVSSSAFPKGTVLQKNDLQGVDFDMSQYVGFVKWFKNDSRLQQIFVGNTWRRRRISTALICAADILIVAGNLGAYLNGGDITTQDGEKLRQAWSESKRVTDRVGSVEKYQ